MKRNSLIVIVAMIAIVVLAGSVLSVGVQAAAPNIQVTMLNQNPDPVEPGSYVELRFKFENMGTEASDSITVEILPEYPFSLDQTGDKTKEIGALQARQVNDEGAIVYYKLRVDEQAVEGTNTIKLRYKAGSGGWITLEKYEVRIRTEDAVLAINEVETNPKVLTSGEPVTITFKLRNMADSLLKDIRLTLGIDSAAVPFAPIGSTNELTIRQLESGGTYLASFDLIVEPSAGSQVYKIPVNLTYADKQGVKYSKKMSFGLKVENHPQYELNLEESKITMPNTKGSVVVSISNIGTSTISFVMMELLPSDDYTILSSSKVYIGNLESDDYETSEYTIFMKGDANATQDVPLKFLLTYKDSYNKEYQDEKEVDLRVYSMSDALQYKLSQPQSPTTQIVTIMIGIVLVIFWLFMLVDAVRHPSHKGVKKALWIALVVFAFVIGAALYYLIGRKRNGS